MSVRRHLTAIVLTVAMVLPLGVAPAGAETSGRLGLHVTTAELELWRTRAAAGPYRAPGDVSTNSPGDWQRIVANSAAFRAAPGAHRWSGPTDTTGCVDGSTTDADQPRAANGTYLRDAAFHALVTDDAALRRAVATELHAQSQVASLDFADRAHWCLGRIWDLNPGFEIANWMTTLLYVLEYVEIGDELSGSASLTAAQRTDVLDWMAAAAEWMNHDNQVKLASNFTDRTTRAAPPYTLTDHRAATPDHRAEPYDGEGVVIGAVARFYNNRRAATQRFVGLLGLHLLHRDDGYQPPAGALGYTARTYVADSTRFAQDYLAYSAYPAGFVGEFERWQDRLPDLGWAYAVQAIAPVMTYVDALARTGDTSLLGYATAAGVHHTEGAPAGASAKTWRWLVRSMLGYVDGSVARYTSGNPGQAAYRIDGFHTASGWDSAHEVALVPVAGHWDDATIDGALARTSAGTRPYPATPAGFGQYSPWNGDWGTLPGVLFMFAGTAGATTGPDEGTVPTTSPEEDTAPTRAVDLTAACPLGVPSAGFIDTAGNVHATAIDCVSHHGIAHGVTADRFDPSATVTRGQLASFLVRLVDAAGGTLPASGDVAFSDTAGSVHEDAIDRLAAAGIVSGVAPGRFAPGATVTRGQLASMLVGTLEHLGTSTTGPVVDAFTDDDGSVHEDAIDTAAALGLVTGTTATTVAPSVPVRRDQAGSFLARTLSLQLSA